jgi:hypothetical protein
MNWAKALAGMGLAALIGGAAVAEKSLVTNPNFEQHVGNLPVGYKLSGDVSYQYLGEARKDASSNGVALHAHGNFAKGEVAQIVAIPSGEQRAYRFDFRGLAQPGFSLAPDGHLMMRAEFLGEGEKTYDSKNRDLYVVVQQARHDLNVNGDNHNDGAATWRTFSLEFIVPFKDVTRLKLSVAFDKAVSNGSASDFYVDDFDLTPIASPTTKESIDANSHGQVVSLDHLLPIGGRWFYAAKTDETSVPTLFNYKNADRLLYFDGQYETPFAGNMSSWLRAGEKDRSGNIAASDVFVPDNVTVSFDQTSMIVHTRGLPNHPTGQFPQTMGQGLLRNPNYIVEQNSTYYIPLDPQPREGHTITDKNNSNHSLNMGPIGIATNGVVFFNPFDANSQDATNFMDACCGHPNPDGQYHYHKYPICVNTPWSDDGQTHSPLLGWAFDGYPIYGPYESKDVMAKDESGDEKLNGFNMHNDPQRGWHYHVTPGEFPYIIGGYWGAPDRRDLQPPHRMMTANRGGGGGFGPRNNQGMNENDRNFPPGPPPFGPPPGMNP